MIKAGEAGGSLEIILRRLAEFKERTQALKNKVIGALIYPIVVVLFTIAILSFIMMFIIPEFIKMFDEFEIDLPPQTVLLIALSNKMVKYWFVIPLIPITMILFVMLVNKFKAGRMGWHLYLLKLPVLGKLIEKSNLARTTRTLGALVSSGVPILEGLIITRETSGNAMFEKMFTRVTDAIRDGETIARPMRRNAIPPFHPVALFFWMVMFALVPLSVLLIKIEYWPVCGLASAGLGILGGLIYFVRHRGSVVEELVVNMVDVGEETGELDVMLYKVADYYEEEVRTLTDGMMKLIEPLLIIFLGGVVFFIVWALFMPLIAMITSLSK